MGARGVFTDALQDSAVSLLGGRLGQHTCGRGVDCRSVCVSKRLRQARGSTLGDGMNGLCSETGSHVSLDGRSKGYTNQRLPVNSDRAWEKQAAG